MDIEIKLDQAFANCPDVIIHCEEGSYAEQYARSHGLATSAYSFSSSAENGEESRQELFHKMSYGKDQGRGFRVVSFPELSGHVPELVNGLPVLSVGSSSAEKKRHLERIILPDSVHSLEERAFSGWQSLRYVIGGSNLVGVGRSAFWGCRSLKEIELFPGVVHLGAGAFWGCSALEQVKLPDELTYISPWCFACCGSLNSVSFPASLLHLGAWAFLYCVKLERVYLAPGVQSIGLGAFSGCHNLKHVYLPPTILSIDEETPALFSNSLGTRLTPLLYKDGPGYISGLKFNGFEFSEVCECCVPPYFFSCERRQLDSSECMVSAVPVAEKPAGFTYPATEVLAEQLKAWPRSEDKTEVEAVPSHVIRVTNDVKTGVKADVNELIELSDSKAKQSSAPMSGVEQAAPHVINNVTGNVTASVTAHFVTAKQAEANPELHLAVTPQDVKQVVKIPAKPVVKTDVPAQSGQGFAAELIMAMQSEAEDMDGFVLNKTPEGWVVSGYEDEECHSLTIPSQINGLPVWALGEGFASHLSDLREVFLPASLGVIGCDAFRGCYSLRRVIRTLPREGEQSPALRVEQGAFKGCESLQVAELGEVECLGNEAFSGCQKLRAWSGGSATQTVGEGAFANCLSLERLILPQGLRSFGARALRGCRKLQLICLPPSLQEIGGQGGSNHPLSDCPQAYIYARRDTPAWAYAQGTKLKCVSVILAGEDDCADGLEVWCGCTLEEGDYAWEKRGKSAVITRYLLWNGEEAHIPEEIEGLPVMQLADRALADCSNLRAITLPESLCFIGREAFADCSSLESIALPAALEKLGEGAFRNCSSLKECQMSANLTTIEPETWFGCASLEWINLPDTLVTLGSSAFEGCVSLQRLAMSPKLQTMGSRAFWGCHALKELSLPDTLSRVGSQSSKIEAVFDPDAVVSIHCTKGSLGERLAQLFKYNCNLSFKMILKRDVSPNASGKAAVASRPVAEAISDEESERRRQKHLKRMQNKSKLSGKKK